MRQQRILVVSFTVLICLAILCGLGAWQLQRREWKENLLADLQARLVAPPLAWDTSTPPPPEFTRVTVSGDLRADKPLLLYGRTMEGAAGVHVLVSLFPDSGAPVIVDEGFLKLPQTTESASRTAVFQKKITGIVRSSEGQGWFEPDNDAGKNEWFWVDLPRMAGILGIKTIVPVYIEATEPVDTDGPIPTGQSLLANIPNQHLNYAITWFSLAGVLLVIYGVWIRREIQARHGEH